MNLRNPVEEVEIAGEGVRTAPRLLVFDLTAPADGSATGELKANLFAGWPEGRYLQVFQAGRDAVGLARAGGERVAGEIGGEALAAELRAFDPELILYRPVPDAPALHRAALQALDAFPDVPLVTWIMDDWPARLETDDPAQFARLNPDWLGLLERSVLRLSICEAMSEAFGRRYGYPFHPVANGIDPSEWPERRRGRKRGFTLRYAGALADNMTAHSVHRVAEAVEALAKEGHAVRLEIRTRPMWKKAVQARYASLKHTRFFTDTLSAEDYREWLAEADAVLIGYNFDAASLRYVGLSMANKLPECLASGAPLLAHGPLEAATIRYLKENDCALVVEREDVGSIRQALLELMNDPERGRALARRGRELAFARHDINAIRRKLAQQFTELAMQRGGKPAAKAATFGERGRCEHASVDETGVVARLLSGRKGSGHVMLDVGAHFGTSAAFFHPLGWTIHCFEPDPENRRKLVARFGGADNVLIDPRAVSDAPAKGVSFFRSDESTGISGLSAFRDTHREAGKVDVTTVAAIVGERGIGHVDFLKIDVEGFDFNVLKGVPWDKVRPDVIECEFEDLKTVPRGHSWKDMAQFLQDRGYTVYLSEWHPIVRYGIAHDWRRLVRFPCEDLPADAWGNILAFREDPGEGAAAAAFEACLVRRGLAGAGAKAHSGAAQGLDGADRSGMASTYERFVRWTMRKSPTLYRLGRFGMWTLRTARRHAGLAAAFLGLFVLLAVAAVAIPGWPGTVFLLAASLLFVVGAVATSVFYARHLVATLREEIAAQKSAMRTAERRMVTLQQRLEDQGKAMAGNATTVELRLAAAEKGVARASESVAKVQDGLAAAEKGVARVEGAGRETARKMALLEERSPAFSMAHFQRFRRSLGTADIKRLEEEWATPLGVPAGKGRIAYLAHRASALESQMRGRLATGVETIVLRTLVTLAVEREELSILEIGTLFGIGGAILYEAASDRFDTVHLTVIDPLDGYYGTDNRDILTGVRVTEAVCRHNWQVAGIPEADITVIKALSEDRKAIAKAKRRPYDVLVIDGDHSREGVKRDFENYAGMVRPGGFILFDDYDTAEWPDIKAYVDEEVDGLGFLTRVGAGFRTAVYRVREPQA